MRRFTCAIALVLLALPALAADRRFPEAKSGKGELKYVNGIPVLTVEGTPEEICRRVAREHGLPPTLESAFMTWTGRSLDDDAEGEEPEGDD